MTPHETAMRKIRKRWRELPAADRKEKRGTHGVYFTADELRALARPTKRKSVEGTMWELGRFPEDDEIIKARRVRHS